MGQKSTYTTWAGETICAALAEGHSLLSICEAMGIPYATARRWEDDEPEHAANSARARVVGCHAMAESCLQIADDGKNDWMEQHGQDAPGWKVNGEHLQRSRLRIDTRMRLLGKWLPKVYGEKVELAGSLTVKKAAADMTDDELLALAQGVKK